MHENMIKVSAFPRLLSKKPHEFKATAVPVPVHMSWKEMDLSPLKQLTEGGSYLHSLHTTYNDLNFSQVELLESRFPNHKHR